jgi:hypothetical protein
VVFLDLGEVAPALSPHRALAPAIAISLRRFADSFFARAGPPFLPIAAAASLMALRGSAFFFAIRHQFYSFSTSMCLPSTIFCLTMMLDVKHSG